MTTYQICDANGYAITDGLSRDDAHRIAQRIATERGASVWVSASDSEEMGDEVTPADAEPDADDGRDMTPPYEP